MLHLKLRSWAKSLEGREQLAVEKFAEALEINSFNNCQKMLEWIQLIHLATLRSKQSKGEKWTGIDAMKGTNCKYEIK